MERLLTRLLEHPRVVLAAVAVVTLGFALAATRVQIDDSVESMLLQDDPERLYYQRFLQRFGSDELVVVGFKAERPFGRPALELTRRLSTALEGIELPPTAPGALGVPLVDRVVSLSTVTWVESRIEDGESVLAIEPFLHALPGDAAERASLWERAVGDPLYRDNLISIPRTEDFDAPLMTLVLGRLVHREGDLKYRRFVLGRAEEILAREGERNQVAGELHLAGTPILKASLGRTAQIDLATVLPMSLAVSFALLFLLFRSAPAVWIPVATVSCAVVWTVGLLTLCGSHLTVVSTVVLELIQVIGVAITIHLFSRYYDHARIVREPKAILRRTLQHVAWPAFLASFTTAVGFASLAVSKILPVREVGLYAAFGVMAAWLLAVTLAPALLLHVLPPAPSEGRLDRQRRIGRALGHVATLAERFRWPVFLGGIALIVVSVAGISRIRVETDLLGFLDEDHALRTSYDAINGEMSGIHPLDVTVRTAPGELLEPEMLSRIDRFQAWLDAQPEVDRSLSIVDYVKRVHQEMHDGDPQFFRVPETRAEVVAALILLEDAGDAAPFLYPHWEEAEEARVAARLESITSAQTVDLIARIRERLERHVASDASLVFDRASAFPPVTGVRVLDTVWYDLRRTASDLLGRGPAWPEPPARLAADQVSARVTGVTLVYAEMVESLVDGQVSSLFLAFGVIWITVVLMLRSLRAGTVAMLPNVFPITIVLGFMGYAGIALDLGTAMIGSVCMGIAVDDTIHFLTRYRRWLRAHGREAEAIRSTLDEVGRPIVTTSVALALGFMVFAFSGFGPHQNFGLLSAFTLGAALLGDLVLLPACLLIFKPRIPLPRPQEIPLAHEPEQLVARGIARAR